MEKTEVVIRKYELMLIVDSKLTAEEKDGIFKEVLETILKSGAKVINNQIWVEKQKMTFEIKKRREGTYYLINFEGQGAAAQKIRATLKLNEKVLRFAIVVG
jgi:small subunit ribosomal protein S6